MAKGKAKKAVKKGGGSRKAKPPTKEETTEVNNMSLLLGNMPPIRDIMYHLDTIKGLQERAKTAQGKVSDAKKKAKEAGIDLTALALSMGFERMDPLEMATQLRQMQAVMRERGMPIQLSLYEPKFGSVEDQAAAEGWNDGRNGRHANVERWGEGIPGHKEYMRRWNDGQRELLLKGPEKPSDTDEEE